VVGARLLRLATSKDSSTVAAKQRSQSIELTNQYRRRPPPDLRPDEVDEVHRLVRSGNSSLDDLHC
jgi:hypothetical protein